MKKEIILLTTEGCSACRIQAHLISKLISTNNVVFSDVIYKVLDINFVPEWILNNVIINDFPTTIFIADNVIKYHFMGTRTINEMKEIAKDCFNMHVPKEVAKTKQCRKDIDEIIQRVKDLTQCKETDRAITKLQEAVMWLGMNLKRLGEENPYPENKNPESARIEPTADGLKL